MISTRQRAGSKSASRSGSRAASHSGTWGVAGRYGGPAGLPVVLVPALLHWEYEEGAGTVVGATTGPNGTLFADAWDEGILGAWGGNLDGSDCVSDQAIVFGTGVVTLSLWFNTNGNGTPADGRIIALTDEIAPHVSVGFADSGKVTVTLTGTTGARIVQATTVVPEDVWNHLAVVADNAAGGGGGSVLIYLNGVLIDVAVLVATKTGAENFSDSVVTVGDNVTTNWLIDDVRIYDRALTRPQINAITVLPYTVITASDGYPVIASDGGLAFSSPFDEADLLALNPYGYFRSDTGVLNDSDLPASIPENVKTWENQGSGPDLYFNGVANRVTLEAGPVINYPVSSAYLDLDVAGPVAGTSILVLNDGIFAVEVALDADTWNFGLHSVNKTAESYPAGNVVMRLNFPTRLTDAQLANVKVWLRHNGGPPRETRNNFYSQLWGDTAITEFRFPFRLEDNIDYAFGAMALTSFPNGFDYSLVDGMEGTWTDSNLTSFPAIVIPLAVTGLVGTWALYKGVSFPVINTGHVENFGGIFASSPNLISLPGLDFGSALVCSQLCQNCVSLTTVPAGIFDTTACVDFAFAFRDTALTEESVDNILVSLDTAGESNGTVDIDGGTSSPPSAVGLAAKTSLEAKGWTVNVN